MSTFNLGELDSIYDSIYHLYDDNDDNVDNKHLNDEFSARKTLDHILNQQKENENRYKDTIRKLKAFKKSLKIIVRQKVDLEKQYTKAINETNEETPVDNDLLDVGFWARITLKDIFNKKKQNENRYAKFNRNLNATKKTLKIILRQKVDLEKQRTAAHKTIENILHQKDAKYETESNNDVDVSMFEFEDDEFDDEFEF